jgi:hypothetical protein
MALPNLRCELHTDQKCIRKCSCPLAIFASSRTSEEEKQVSRVTFYKLYAPMLCRLACLLCYRDKMRADTLKYCLCGLLSRHFPPSGQKLRPRRGPGGSCCGWVDHQRRKTSLKATHVNAVMPRRELAKIRGGGIWAVISRSWPVEG